MPPHGSPKALPRPETRPRPLPLRHEVTGSGPLLVAIHGITEDHGAWDRVPLDDHFRVVRVDLRGHGRSARTGPYDPLTLATDVHELIAARAGGERPLVVGHSYGGVVATTYASRFPVRGVVTVDQRLDVAPLPEAVALAVRGPGFGAFMSSFFSEAYGDLDQGLVAELDARRELRQDVVLGTWAPLLDLGAVELTTWMRDLITLPRDTPYLSMHGLPVAEEYVEWLRTTIPSAGVETAPTVTHYPHLADPQWFVERVVAFDAAPSSPVGSATATRAGRTTGDDPASPPARSRRGLPGRSLGRTEHAPPKGALP